jgi:hypothetical protein
MFKINLLRTTFLQLPQQRPKNWATHMMAPAAHVISPFGLVEIFVGGWDENGISSIYSLEMNLKELKFMPDTIKLRLNKGMKGSFDENGVFPGSVIVDDHEKYLSYTGFQLGEKIPHFNFSGIVSLSGKDSMLTRQSQAPILDRSDEGLYVRAGLTSILVKHGYSKFWCSAYAAGSSFEVIKGKERPNYNIFTQFNSPFSLVKKGTMAVEFNSNEHGVGRPYLVSHRERILLFYTRRMKDFNYRSGLAISLDNGKSFSRQDYLLENLSDKHIGLDDQMQYFPAPILFDNKIYVLYSGNNFGEKGIGIWEIQLD